MMRSPPRAHDWSALATARWIIPIAGVAVPALMIWSYVGRSWDEISLRSAISSALPWVLLGAFYLTLVPMMARMNAKKALENDPSLRGSQTRIVDESGLHVRGAAFSQDFSWQDIVKAVESPEFFLLFYNRRMAHYIPKRALDASGIETVRELIRRHLPTRRVAESSANHSA